MDIDSSQDYLIDDSLLFDICLNVEKKGATIEERRVFYGRIFPSLQIYRWLCRGRSEEIFEKREFSYTVNERYMRPKSYKTHDSWRKDLLLINPEKIDIGAIYGSRPTRHNFRTIHPKSKEFVLDIDINDYDNIRTCCDGPNICKLCWEYIIIAVKIIQLIITKQFGFEMILWVFSGRRGVHCWICDESAMCLTNSERRRIIQFISIWKDQPNNSGFTGKKGIDPNLKLNCDPFSIYIDLLYKHFVENILEQQNIFKTERIFKIVLYFIPESFKNVRKTLQTEFDNFPNSNNEERWESFKQIIKSEIKNVDESEQIINQVIFYFTFPRLDENVSLNIGHLLKCPFVIHPQTEKICAPIDPLKISDFDPLTIPTLSSLMNELNTIDSNDTYLPSLSEYLKYFESFIDRLIEHCKRNK
jgi:DNA primase small subunit